MKISQPGLYEDIPEKDYHADPVGNSLSSTMAKEILKSPAHLRHMLDTPRESKPAFDIGSAVHTEVLGTGWPVKVLEFDSWRTKASQEAKAVAEAAGEIPILTRDHAPVKAMAENVLDHEIAGPLFKGDGTAEVSAFAPDPETGVWLRGRFDWLTKSGIIVDLKTAVTSDPDEFTRTAWTLGYMVQAAHYLRTYRLATGTPARGFVHVLVSKEEPHLVSVNQLDSDFLDLGEMRLERALHRYKHALETNQWPGYPATIHTVSPQAWMTYAEDDAQEKETA